MVSLKKELELMRKEHDDIAAALEDARNSHGAELELLKSSHATELELEMGRAEDATRRLTELEAKLSQQVKQHQEFEKKWEMEKQSLTTVAAASVSELGEASIRSRVAEENYKWLMDRGLKDVFAKLIESPEYVSHNGTIQAAHYGVGMNLGMQLGYSYVKMNMHVEKVPGYDARAADKLQKAEEELKGATYPYLELIAANRDLPPAEFKKIVLGVNSAHGAV